MVLPSLETCFWSIKGKMNTACGYKWNKWPKQTVNMGSKPASVQTNYTSSVVLLHGNSDLESPRLLDRLFNTNIT